MSVHLLEEREARQERRRLNAARQAAWRERLRDRLRVAVEEMVAPRDEDDSPNVEALALARAWEAAHLLAIDVLGEDAPQAERDREAKRYLDGAEATALS